MSLEDARRQKTRQLVLPLEGRGEAPTVQRSGEASTAASGNERPGTDRLMEEVVQRGNAKAALKRVKQNKGSPGVDGMTVLELPEYLADHWEEIREELLAGTYQPKPVKRQEIPKSGGGVRELGIPTTLDRFVQQAILQVRGHVAAMAALFARNWWKVAGHKALHMALPTSYYDRMGIPTLAS